MNIFKSNRVVGYFLVLLSFSNLTACGGSGGSSSPSKISTPPPAESSNEELPADPSESVDHANTMPTLSSLNITDINGGKTLIGDQLQASYQYTDVESDLEGASVVRWLRNDIEIEGATDLTYIIQVEDIDKELRVEIQPIALTGSKEGSFVKSDILNPVGLTYLPVRALSDSGTNTKIGKLTGDGGMVVVNSEALGHVFNSVNLNGKALMWTSSAQYGIEPWVSNGTEEGTILLSDTNLGIADGGSLTSTIVVAGEKGYFSAGAADTKTLWVTDGTSAGTNQILVDGVVLSDPLNITRINDGILFNTVINASSESVVTTLWRSNGTTEGTVKVAVDNKITSLKSFIYKDEQLVLVGRDRVFFDLYKIDSSTTIATKLISFETGFTGVPTPLNVEPLVLAYETGDTYCLSYEEKRSGTHTLPDGTSIDIPLPGSPQTYCTGDIIENLTKVDLSSVGVTEALIVGVNVSKDEFYLRGKFEATNQILFSSNLKSTDFSTILQKSFYSLFMANGKTSTKDFFLIDGEVWSSDGSAENTQFLNVKSWSSQFAELNDRLFFAPSEITPQFEFSSKGVWVTDGTIAGTKEVIVTPTAKGNVSPPFAMGDRIYYFHAGVNQTEELEFSLFESDGTPEGSQLMIRNNTSFVGRLAK